jgi:two-component system, NarL family, invasion response regulator UvrY
MINDPIRVVIVDDHQMVRETWKMLLQRDERLQVIGECTSGEEAIAIAQSMAPNIMLMDINMYPMNGLEATKEISRLTPTVKIIGVSINNQPSYAKNMLLAGAKGYVTKNSSREEMIQAIIQVQNGETFICKEIQDKMNKI